MIGLDSIELNAAGIKLDADHDGVRCWHVDSVDLLNCWYFPFPPNDLAAPPSDINAIRSFNRSKLKENGTAIISIDATEIDGCAAVLSILKARIPNRQHGMLYIAAITIPFRDFCFVLKTICEELGPTGMREAVIVDCLIKEGKIKSTPSGLIGWSADPYDENFQANILRNLSEDEKYDAMFPSHPLSRARRILRMLENHASFSDEVKSAPGFDGSKNLRKRWLWWQ